MKEKVHLKYACPIPWDQMLSSGEKHRFCQACKKHIRDFSAEDQVDTTGVECGRFSAHQVARISRQFNWNKNAVAVFSIATVLGLSTQALQAQNKSDTHQPTREIFKGSYKLSGIIKDQQSDKALPFANVIIREANGPLITGAVTNFDGHFEILIGADDLNRLNLIAEVSFTGFQKTILDTLNFDPNCRNKVILVSMAAAENELEEVNISYTTTGLIDLDHHSDSTSTPDPAEKEKKDD